VVYDIGDVLPQIQSLLPDLKRLFGEPSRSPQSNDGAALLIGYLTNAVPLRSWETIQIQNGRKLAILASPTRHEEIDGLVRALHRLSDVAVVMNARLYEVDRAFFTKQVAPLFPQDKSVEERPALVPIDSTVLKAITQQKCLLKSEDNKIRPRQTASFLSQQSVVRFAAGPHPTNNDQALMETALTGVSFEVRPLVSPDRRYLRLQIGQQVVQVVGIDKVKTLDGPSGKEVERPNLRKASLTATIEIPDGLPILMPVAYRPPGKDNADKVWLLVARPFIWIEEEVQEIRKGGGNLTPQSVWDSEVPKEESPRPAILWPINDE